MVHTPISQVFTVVFFAPVVAGTLQVSSNGRQLRWHIGHLPVSHNQKNFHTYLSRALIGIAAHGVASAGVMRCLRHASKGRISYPQRQHAVRRGNAHVCSNCAGAAFFLSLPYPPASIKFCSLTPVAPQVNFAVSSLSASNLTVDNLSVKNVEYSKVDRCVTFLPVPLSICARCCFGKPRPASHPDGTGAFATVCELVFLRFAFEKAREKCRDV
jgi:hypothetical protein